MTAIDWIVLAFVLLMAVWGYQQGLIVGALSLAGFAAGAFLGSRYGPELLADGSRSPFAPLTALIGALLVGGAVALVLEGAGLGLRERLIRGPASSLVDGLGGAVLIAALGLGLAWLFGAVALQSDDGLRRDVQRSRILRTLNAALPPTGDVLRALRRVDPFPRIRGPEAAVPPPSRGTPSDPDIRAARASVVRILGTACGLGVQGTGWVARPGLVVTNAHVVAGEDDTTVQAQGVGPRLRAVAVHYEPANDLAILRVGGLGAPPLALAADVRPGGAGAILGFPKNGSYAAEPARIGATDTVISQDAYGRGPLTRQMVSLRGVIRSGNSGGPVVDRAGDVVATVFAATLESARPGGFGVPNAIVRDALERSDQPVGTGPCTR
jgi:S1-C subfamily serine protease